MLKGSSNHDWEVTLVTGDKRGAGTDANVSITFFGSKATSFKTPLKTKLEVGRAAKANTGLKIHA